MRKTGVSVVSWLLAHRTPFVILLQLALVVLSSLLAMRLRFDGDIPARTWHVWLLALPWLLVLRGLAFGRFRLHQGLWRYASIWDLRNIVAAVFVSSVLHYALIHWVFGWTIYPRSVFVIDAALLILLLGGARMVRRIYREFHNVNHEKRVLIYGAGDAGEMIVRDKRNNGFYEY
jgi:FlaA1/EpsC-like NDP-sugar epimerase